MLFISFSFVSVCESTNEDEQLENESENETHKEFNKFEIRCEFSEMWRKDYVRVKFMLLWWGWEREEIALFIAAELKIVAFLNFAFGSCRFSKSSERSCVLNEPAVTSAFLMSKINGGSWLKWRIISMTKNYRESLHSSRKINKWKKNRKKIWIQYKNIKNICSSYMNEATCSVSY